MKPLIRVMNLDIFSLVLSHTSCIINSRLLAKSSFNYYSLFQLVYLFLAEHDPEHQHEHDDEDDAGENDEQLADADAMED
jgi:hypothetical protein